MKSGDFNFETEGEKKLSIGLDFIPVIGIEKMTLEGLLGEDLVSGKDLNGLARIPAVAPAGILLYNFQYDESIKVVNIKAYQFKFVGSVEYDGQ